MSTTKVPNFMVSPFPPSESETIAALNNKVNTSTYNSDLNSLQGRLDSLENLSISSRLSNIENNYVTTNTTQTLTGTKIFNNNRPIIIQNKTIDLGTAPDTTKNSEILLLTDSSGIGWSNTIGLISTSITTENLCSTNMQVRSNTSSKTTGRISVFADASGNVYTYAPTPATTDNSNQIATTAYVKSNLANYVTTNTDQTLTGTKTITSNLNLSPSSSSSNTGGQINFHYNQSSSPTASIYENAPGTIRLNGDLSISGRVMSNIVAMGPSVPIRIYDMNPTSTTVQRFIQAYDDSGSTAVGSLVFTSAPEAASHDVRLRANNAGTNADLGVSVLSDGTKFTFAPTPATSDNSTKIATTAFVNNRLPYTSGTWTPTCYGYTTAGSTTISGNNCKYVKIGRLVILNVSFTFTVKTAPTGQVRIGGLPFTCDKNAYGLFWSSGHIGYILTASSNVLYIRNVANSIPYLVSWGTSTWDNTVDSTGTIEGSVVYFTA